MIALLNRRAASPSRNKLMFGLAAFLLAISQASLANPTGGRVTAGAAVIGPGAELR